MEVAFYKSPIGVLKIYSSSYALKKIELVKERNDFECSTFNYNVIEQIEAYFAGRLHTFNIPVEFTNISDIQRKVYDELLNVRFGRTITYKELASKVGCTNGYRAIGNSLAKNPVPLIIPCHRVIRTDGSIGNYSLGGIDNKRFLLDFEKNHC